MLLLGKQAPVILAWRVFKIQRPRGECAHTLTAWLIRSPPDGRPPYVVVVVPNCTAAVHTKRTQVGEQGGVY